MSIWTTVEGEFKNPIVKPYNWESEAAPRGSEGGLDKPYFDKGTNSWTFYGRLRDHDDWDSPRDFAWWVDTINHCLPDSALLTIDIDRGPRYSWTYDKEKGIQRQRGILE